jgi:3-hydroxyisobutyrate dehydrogenase-like beta-hydroxyacid dehydrogenase
LGREPAETYDGREPDHGPPDNGSMVIGLLHPGEMGAAVGRELRGLGHEVCWVPGGRGPQTAARAAAAGLSARGSLAGLTGRSDVILSVCPPHAAVEVALAVAGFRGIFVDANAVSPATSRRIGQVVTEGGGRYVDGGIIGPPPPGGTRLYLAGPDALVVGGLFSGCAVQARVVDGGIGAASAVKMAYAAWTKGTAALLLAIRALARAEDVEETLLAEWAQSQPALAARSDGAARSALGKGWRWVAEMNEIAATFGAAGLPAGFHQAAADIFGRAPRQAVPDDAAIGTVVAGLLARG